MKNLLFLFFGMAFLFSGCNCQWKLKTSPGIGVIAGAGITHIIGEESFDPKAGGTAGAEAELFECNAFSSVRIALLFSFLGAVYQESIEDNPYELYQTKSAFAENEFSGKVSLSYLHIPILYRYQGNSGFYGEAGIQPGYLISAKDKIEGEESYDYKDYIKTFDIGIPVGLGYQINDRLDIGARAVFGVTNINTDGTEMYSPDDANRNFMMLAVARYKINK
jgi:hypothetical protein